HDDTLTVTATREKTEEESGDRFFRFERRYGTFSRAVGLPAGVDEAKIAASYVDGVLEVRVPKPEEAKPRKIQLGTSRPDVEA
ncbi:MAG: Hsp20/alpha crystallin family protein, partial [Gaiella sp.]